MAIKKQQLSEDSQWNLDRLFKLTMTGFFGSEMIDKAAKKRAAQKKAIKAKKRVNIAQGKIRGTTVYAKRGGLMKPIHKDYRKGGLFKKGK